MTTIYRAADTADCFTGSHWTSCEDEAAEYTRNPGFGGGLVWDMVLDGEVVVRCDDTVELAEVVLANGLETAIGEKVYAGCDEDGEEIYKTVYRPMTALELAAEWSDYGYDQVFHVLESVSGVLACVKGDWIRFNEPSIRNNGQYSVTYRKL